MKLLTKNIEDKLRKAYNPIPLEDDNPKAFVKLFNPAGKGTWYLSDLSENDIAFGLCNLQETEYGYVSLNELKSLTLPFGLSIERDMNFDPMYLKDIKSKLDNGEHV